MPTFPPRIHVLLASRTRVGVVIRRGPSKSVATLLWNRDTDEFTLGQWLRGRIYERRSDLSPDGKYLIYFAMNGQWNSESRGSWTAVSRAPYLKAIAFYPKGDCWNGGGLWTSGRLWSRRYTYWLNGQHIVDRETSEVSRNDDYRPEGGCGNECLGVYYPRLLRDGWRLIDGISEGGWSSTHIFEKPLGNGWTLRKIAQVGISTPVGKGCYWDEHEVIGPDRKTRQAHPEWEWADRDGDRVVWATGGRLFAARVGVDGPGDERELHDFRDMAFEAIEAPY